MVRQAVLFFVALGASSSASAFSYSAGRPSMSKLELNVATDPYSGEDAVETSKPVTDSIPIATLEKMIDAPVKVEKKLPRMSESMPFLKRPLVLTGELAGDVGFDPLGFAKNRETLWEMREAEIKHGRLAMLGAAGWPISELLDRKIAEWLEIPSTLDAGDRVPTFLNGGMEKVSPKWWGFCLGLAGAIDLYSIQRARSAGLDSGYIPGDLQFDPLGMYPEDEEGRKRMQLAEIKHGRLGMIAILGFTVQEAISKVGVVDETPFFFFPITKTLGTAIQHFSK
eukprot:scaffold4708_cov55-Attheya_sp.AAC.3